MSNVPKHCEPRSSFLLTISSTFHTCVPTPLAFISTVLGILSIVSWLFAQTPQIYKNYQLKSASGLSIYFLTEWLLGDLTNLIGAILTHQAAWQIVVATYYCTVDITLVWQYFWYSYVKRWNKRQVLKYHTNSDGRDRDSRELLIGVAITESNSGSDEDHIHSQGSRSKVKDISDNSRDTQYQASDSSLPVDEKVVLDPPRFAIKRPFSPCTPPSAHTILLAASFGIAITNALPLQPTSQHQPQASTKSELTGQVVSWVSAFAYLCSRLPQIYKNARRRSTAGLSPTLFIAAFGGNFFYSTSMLTNPLAWANYPPYGAHGWAGPEGSKRKAWLKLGTPFFLGAAGVLALDAAVGMQFLAFKERDVEKIVLIDGERPRRWGRVRGWMRGWVPSPSPNRGVAGGGRGAEEPLINSIEREAENYGAT